MDLPEAYSSNRNWSNVQLVLHGYRCLVPPGDDIIDQWFVVTPSAEVRSLGAGMWLVDAGDYDNGGKSGIVFSINCYNEGGHELFYDDFQGHAVFSYDYHESGIIFGRRSRGPLIGNGAPSLSTKDRYFSVPYARQEPNPKQY